MTALALGCGERAAPTEPGPEPAPVFDEELRVSGHVTSEFDDSAVGGARIRVIASAPGDCDTWDIICENSTWTVAETRSKEDGSFQMRFRHPHCRSGRAIAITIEAEGFALAEPRAECLADPQRIDVRLRPVPRLDFSVQPDSIVTDRPVRVTVAASSGAGLVSLHFDWGDESGADVVEMTSRNHETELSHIYEVAGTYSVEATIKDAAGSENWYSFRLSIGACLLEDGVPCEPLRSSELSGSWTGTAYVLDTFTLESAGPVEAVATVTGYDGQMRLALLGFNPDAETSPCSTEWLPATVSRGPAMAAPAISAYWEKIPAGTYCLNVVSDSPPPPHPDPFSWTATVTYP